MCDPPVLRRAIWRCGDLPRWLFEKRRRSSLQRKLVAKRRDVHSLLAGYGVSQPRTDKRGDRRPIRVLLVGPSTDIAGGQALQAQSLLAGFRTSARIEANFISVNPRLPGVLRSLQRVKYLRTIVTTIAYLVSLLKHTRRYQVLHAFSASYWSYLLAPFPALVIGRLAGCKVILNYRSGEASDHLRRWPLSRYSIRKLPHAIVVPSNYLVDEFGQFNIAAESIVNVVALDHFPFKSRDVARLRLLSNRNLEPLYNVECVIRAFALIHTNYPHARLVIAGDGSERARLEELSRSLALSDAVRFVGYVGRDEMMELYAQSDVYVNAPNIDNMPASILEAFACGLPVVTTSAGGISYIVEHDRTGILVNCGAVDELAAGVLRLVRDPAAADRMARAARAECERRYVWSEVRRQWEECYERVVCAR